MSYTINHTAEQIDHKLDLINENKNLLPYPYDNEIVFPEGLEDVGDGSILVTKQVDFTEETDILLNTCMLPAGKKYTVSMACAQALQNSDLPVDPAGSSLPLSLKIVPSTDSGVAPVVTYNNGSAYVAELDLTEVTTALAVSVEAYLVGSSGSIDAGLLFKPQIEEGDTSTAWVPHMKDIGSYVDERFNGLNAKFSNVIKSDSITVGSTTLTEADIKAILEFMTSYTNYERSDTTADS